MSNEDIIQCEKMVEEFHNYHIEGFHYNAFIRVLVFEEYGFYPDVWFGSEVDMEEKLKEEFESLDFDNCYDANDLVIVLEGEDCYDYEDDYADECYKDLKELFGKIFASYFDCATVSLVEKEKLNELKEELETMRKEVFHKIFGEKEPLPDKLGNTENLITLKF